MLTHVNNLKETAALLQDTANFVRDDAVAAVETLKGCREFVTKTVVALTENHEAVVAALAERHTHLMAEFNGMLARIDDTIDKLEGGANG